MGKQKTEHLPILVSVGEIIRKKRKELGLSQEKLAELAELHTTTISEIECGKSNLSIVTLEKIAISLDAPVDSLIPGVHDTGGREMAEIIFRIMNNHEKLNAADKKRHKAILKSIAEIYGS